MQGLCRMGHEKRKSTDAVCLITILIYMVATVLVVMKVWGVRESDHLLFQMLLWGDWIPELETFLNPADNTICYQKKWYRIGGNTIENIYPPENSIHGWITRKIKPAASSMYRDLWRS